MNKKTVALIFGGEGGEHNVSVMGADFVRGELEAVGFSVLPVLISGGGEWLLCDKVHSCRDMDKETSALTPTYPVRLGKMCGFLKDGEILSVCAAVPLLHGEVGEGGCVQGALRCAGIPYIGCDTVTGALCIDKAFTKLIAADAGIPVAKGIYSHEGEDIDELTERAERTVGYPMFIKPTRLGSSIGAGIAKDRCELMPALNKALSLGSGRIIVEELLSPVRELECAAACINGKLLFTDIGEISCKSGFYDYENKYGEASGASICECAELTDDIKNKIQAYSKIIAERVGIKGLSRIDFMLTANGKIYFNEINTFPGMTKVSMFPRLIERAGVRVGGLLLSLIEELD